MFRSKGSEVTDGGGGAYVTQLKTKIDEKDKMDIILFSGYYIFNCYYMRI